MTTATTELHEQVRELKARGSKFERWGLAKAGVGIIAAVAAVGSYVLSRYLGPDAIPATLDVPALILSRFAGSVTHVGGAGSLGGGLPWESPLPGMLAALTGPGMFTLSTVGVVIGGGVVIFCDDCLLKTISRLVLTIGIMLGSLSMAQTFIGGGADDTPQISARDAFAQAVKDRDTSAIQKALGTQTSAADQYVRAQLELIKGAPLGPALLRDTADWIVSSQTAKTDFTPRGDVAYAIERAAYGSPRSTYAETYYRERQVSAARPRHVATGLGAVAVLCLLVGAGLFGFGRSINARAGRIEVLAGLERRIPYGALTNEQKAAARALHPFKEDAERVASDPKYEYLVDAEGVILGRELRERYASLLEPN